MRLSSFQCKSRYLYVLDFRVRLYVELMMTSRTLSPSRIDVTTSSPDQAMHSPLDSPRRYELAAPVQSAHSQLQKPTSRRAESPL